MDLDFRRDPAVLSVIVDAMGAGVFTVDAQARFVAWSDGAERITGYASRDIIGQPCQILEGPNCRGFGSLADLMQAADPATPGICDQQCKILARDGHELHIHGNVRLLYEDGRLLGAVGTFLDVTNLVHASALIERLEQQVHAQEGFEPLIGQSVAMREAIRRLRLAADSDVTVLLTGESGTGKELAARAVHARSNRRDRPFLAINCSAIPDALLESELFGHVRGAFTGAAADKQGLFEAADGGTLFLDEIGDVSPTIQVKLLRALQEREVRRIGDSHNRAIDIRLITATNRDLRRLLVAGTIREDFYYRIHVFAIRMPPLRERRDDIPRLVEHFLAEFGRQRTRAITGITRDALQCLMDYHWPGNVRQLRNTVEIACVSAAGDRITYLDLPAEIRDPRTGQLTESSTSLTHDEVAERERIIDALRQTGGNRTQAAALLGTSRVTLWKKMAKYAIDAPG
ncbi:MAG: sigma-54 interaction domain-containing protein [Pirellulaceae bacterium]